MTMFQLGIRNALPFSNGLFGKLLSIDPRCHYQSFVVWLRVHLELQPVFGIFSEDF